MKLSIELDLTNMLKLKRLENRIFLCDFLEDRSFRIVIN